MIILFVLNSNVNQQAIDLFADECKIIVEQKEKQRKLEAERYPDMAENVLVINLVHFFSERKVYNLTMTENVPVNPSALFLEGVKFKY